MSIGDVPEVLSQQTLVGVILVGRFWRRGRANSLARAQEADAVGERPLRLHRQEPVGSKGA